MLNDFKKNFKQDFPASIVVFLVAVPLCLGISLASGAPLMSGIIAGIVGGIVVTAFSGSSLGVSGPAAGLAVIVLSGIESVGGFEAFLLAAVLAGVIQLILGFVRAGIVAYYFPSSVIKGMLAAIGIIIFFKQIPHAVGYDRDYEGDLTFMQADGENTFSELVNMLNYFTLSAFIISMTGLAILILWETNIVKKRPFLKQIPAPLLVVGLGIALHLLFIEFNFYPLANDQLVNIPVMDSISGFREALIFPDFTAIGNVEVWKLAFVLAIVASLETLLCLEATDKLDPLKRISPTNRELRAQGIGNIVSPLIGGLPVTQVIVRSSTNIQTGGMTRASAFMHGWWILLFVALLPQALNLIPLASLASILLLVGYKLAKPSLFVAMKKTGKEQFIPFVVTVLAIVFTDLLTGIIIGMVVAVFFILFNNYQNAYLWKIKKDEEGNDVIHIKLAEDVTFLNKARIMHTLKGLPEGTKIIIDASKTLNMHSDVLEIIEDFKVSEKHPVELTGFNIDNKEHPRRQSKGKITSLQQKVEPLK
ncbi:MAG: SulP family inorganic anion transporter [Candidatus Cyclobacteriaceae bacterium M2_1C_046]